MALRPTGEDGTTGGIEISPEAQVVDATGSDSVELPEGFSFATAEFVQNGPDLILEAPDGTQVVVQNYFGSENPPTITTPEGGELAGETAVRLAQVNNPTQVAQAGSAADAQPIGQVESVTGTVTAIRANGERVELEVGDAVFQGDVLQSSEDGAVGVVLADETTFSMAENGRMVLDEMVYDPSTQEGNISMSVLEGVFTFVSGQVAKVDPDAMTLKTPVATIGIRGTQVGLDLSGGESGDEPMKVVLMEESDGFVGEVVITNAGGVQILNLPDQGAFVSSANEPPTEPRVFERSEVSDSFREALDHIPTDVGTGNDYRQDDTPDQDDQTQDENPEDEIDTAAGGDEDSGEEFAEETDAVDGAEEEGFETAAGDEDEAGEEFAEETGEAGEEFAEETGESNEEFAEDTGESNEEFAEETGEEDPEAFETAAGGDGQGGEGGAGGDDINVTDGEQITTGTTQEFTGDDSTQNPTTNENEGDESTDGNDGTDTPPPAVNNAPTVNGTVNLTAFDEDGSTIITTAELLANASDPDGDALSVSGLNIVPENAGDLVDNGNGTWTYTPSADFNGDVAFSYTISDGANNVVANANVTVNAVNDAADISGPGGDVVEDTTLTATGQLTISDVDGEAEEAFQVADETQPLSGEYGSLTIDAAGNWEYTLDNDENEIQQLPVGETLSDTVTVTSADGTTHNIEITITGTNDAPEVDEAIADQEVDEGAAFSLDVSDNFTDIDTNADLEFTATLENGDDLPDWLSFDGESGTFSGTPGVNDATDFAVTVTATDGDGGSVSDTFNIEVNDTLQEQEGDLTLTGPTGGTVEAVETDSNVDIPLGITAVITDDDGGTVEEFTDTTVTLTFPNGYPVDDQGDLLISFNVGNVQIIDVDPGNDPVLLWSGDTGDLNGLTMTVPADWSGAVNVVADGTTNEGGNESISFNINVSATEDITITAGDNPYLQEDAGPYNLGLGASAVTITDADGSESIEAINLTFGPGLPEGFTLTDVNGNEVTMAFNPNEGTYSVNATSLDLSGLKIDTPDNWNGEIEVGIEATSNEGTDSESFTLTVNAVDDAADIGGDVSGAAVEDSILTASGQLTIEDVDDEDDEAFVVADSSAPLSGNYGSLTIDAEGNWTYTLDNEEEDVQALGEGDPLTDTITVTSVDGTEQTITINITGTDDVPTIEGDTSDTVTEDSGSLLEASGTLTATDADAGESGFQAQTDTAGTHGTFSIDADGNWSYEAANDQAAIDALSPGESLTETFTVTTNGGVEETITVTIEGTNDAPTVAGNVTLTNFDEDGSITITPEQLLAQSDDVDNPNDLTVSGLTASVGVIVGPDASGNYLFTPDADFNGPVTFNFSVSDGIADPVAATASVTVNAVADDAVIGGADTGATVEDGTQTASGQLTISDVDGEAEEAFTVGDDIAGSYGTLDIDAEGNWTYTLDNDSEAVQSLGEGDPLTDTVTITSVDGTAHTITVSITGTNDVPEIAGVTTGAVTEDGTQTANGQLTIDDADTGESSFQAADDVAGSYGTLDIDANGNWTYTLNNDSEAVQSLGEGDPLVETITVLSADGTEQTITINITGSDDAPSIVGDTTGAVTEDSAATLEASGTLTATDDDTGESGFEEGEFGGDFGTLTIDADGNWNYQAASDQPGIQALGENDTTTDTFTVTTAGGVEETITITITGTNDVPDISGDIAGAVTEDDGTRLTTDGQLDIEDVDQGESAFEVQTDTAGDYGTFSVDADGSWSYTAANNQDAIQELGVGDTLTDTFAVVSADGTEQVVTVTINGTNDVPELTSEIADQAISEGDAFSLDVSGNFDDADIPTGDALTFSATQENGDPLPDWLTIDPVTGVLSGTPGNDDDGSFAVTVTATDETGATASDTFGLTVDPTNEDPVAVDDSVIVGDDAGDIITGNVITNDSDADGDTLFISEVSFEGQSYGFPEGEDTMTVEGALGTLTISTDGSYEYVKNGEAAEFDPEWADDTPEWVEPSERDPLEPLNVVDQDNLTMPEGGEAVTVTFQSEGAGYHNVFGWYKLDENGDPTEPQIIWEDSSAQGSGGDLIPGQSTATLEGLAPGEEYGFFIIRDGAEDWITTDTEFSFDENGNLVSGDNTIAEDQIFHSVDPDLSDEDLNVDNIHHAAQGVGADGNLWIGFEDLTGGGDEDYNDLVFSVDYTGTASDEDVFGYTISDGEGGFDTATLTINVEEDQDAPEANDDVATTGENASVTIDVLANDTDADGDTLTLETASLPQGTGGSVSIVDGEVVFNPGTDYDGLDVGDSTTVDITYTVSDGQGGTDTGVATVTITGSNDGPVAQAGTASTVEDNEISGQLIATDADESATLTFSLAPGGDGETVSAGGAGASQSDWNDAGVTISAFDFGTSFVNGDGKFDASLADDTPTFTYDGVGVAGTQGAGDVSNQIEHDSNSGESEALALTFDSSVSEARITVDRLYKDEGGSGEDGMWHAYDADGNLVGSGVIDNSTVEYGDSSNEGTLTINLDGGATFQTVVFTATELEGNTSQDSDFMVRSVDYDTPGDTGPEHGSVVINADGSYTYTPDEDYAGTDSFTYQVTDEHGAVSTETVTIDVTPDADAPDLTVTLGDPVETSDGGVTPTAYWKLDEDYDQNSGNDLFYDAVGTYHAESINVGDDADGVFGDAAEFDGNNDYLKVDHDPAFELDSGTITLRFKADDEDDRQGLFSKDSSYNDDGGHMTMWVDDGTVKVRMQDADYNSGGTNSSFYVDGGDIDDDEWHQVSFSWGDDGMKLYVDGQLVDTNDYDGGIAANGNPWIFGASQWTSGDDVADNLVDFFDGDMDDVAIYNSQLSDEIVGQLYTDGVQALIDADDGAVAGLTYPITIEALATDADGSESISAITIEDLPSDAVLSAGEKIGDVWHIDPDDVAGLTVTVPENSGDFTMKVTATSTEDVGGDTETTTIEVPVEMPNVAPELGDGPSLSMNEDGTIAITADQLLTNATDADGDDLSVTDLVINGGSGTLTGPDANGDYSYTPAADWSGSLELAYNVTDGEASVAQTGTLTVTAVADAPDLTATVTYSGAGTTETDVPVSQSLLDQVEDDHVVTITGVPAGATLSAGSGSGGVWTVSGADLADLTITPAEGDSSDFDLAISVTDAGASETALAADFNSGYDNFYWSDEFNDSGNDSYASGWRDSNDGADGSGVLEMKLGGYDSDDVTDISGGFKTDFTVTEGGDATLSFSFELEMTSSYEPGEYSEVLVAIDGELVSFDGNDFIARNDSGDAVSGWQNVTIDLGDLAAGAHTIEFGGFNNQKTSSNEWTKIRFDNIDLSIEGDDTVVASENLDFSPASAGDVYDLDIAAAVTDDSEAITSITVTDLPEGATLSAGSESGGVWTLTSGELADLQITVPEGTPQFDLSIAAVSTETSNDDSATSTISVTVETIDPNDHDDMGADTDDNLVGTGDQDVLYGGAGNDDIRGKGDDDVLYGGSGDDTLKGEGGSDDLYGGSGDDTLIGSGGDDSLLGGDGDDYLLGGGGLDYLDGGAGGDVIEGSGSDDIIIGGEGNDELYGGGGDDDFVFSLGDGNDTIFDFDDGDQLTFEGIGEDDISFEADGDDVVITVIGNGDSDNPQNQITLKDAAKDMSDEEKANVGDSYSTAPDPNDPSSTIIINTDGG